MSPARFASLPPLADRGPLRVLFLITSMPIGGAETLLVNLVRRLDPERFRPEIGCLKSPGPLGEMLADEMPVHSGLLAGKYDLRILGRLTRLCRRRRIDAVITVGAGDKMFWGRLAAWRAGVPVALSALHSTGWPDGVGRLNRLLTPITDAFIAVAEEHGRFLVEQERFPAAKVRVVPNGVDCQRFVPHPQRRIELRRSLGLSPSSPVCGIVAALRPEKNHSLFLQTASLIAARQPDARFVIVGDGPERARLESETMQLGLADRVLFLGSRKDIPDLLATLDLFLLTSDNEASPVSILEAMACELPVVATRVGSVAETVQEGRTGFLAPARDAVALADHAMELLESNSLRSVFGQAGREHVLAHGSLESMVEGYERLIAEIYESKLPPHNRGRSPARPEAAASRNVPPSSNVTV